MEYQEKAFMTEAGGRIAVADDVRGKIGEYILAEDSQKAYETVACGTAYSGSIIIRCADTGIKDDLNRTVWEVPNGTRFVYRYYNGSSQGFDRGRIALYSPTREVKGRTLTLEPDGTVIIPQGMIAVRTWGYNVQGYGSRGLFSTFSSGEKVDPKYIFLDNGEELKVFATDYLGYNEKAYRVFNNNGKPEVLLHPDEVVAQKQFARDQIAKVVEMGFSRKTAVAVMKAAGPGKCVEAAKWAIYAVENNGNVDLLDCVLCGTGGTHGFGWGRMANAIAGLNLDPPSASSSRAFHKLLAGAHVAIVAGVPPETE